MPNRYSNTVLLTMSCFASIVLLCDLVWSWNTVEEDFFVNSVRGHLNYGVSQRIDHQNIWLRGRNGKTENFAQVRVVEGLKNNQTLDPWCVRDAERRLLVDTGGIFAHPCAEIGRAEKECRTCVVRAAKQQNENHLKLERRFALANVIGPCCGCFGAARLTQIGQVVVPLVIHQDQEGGGFQRVEEGNSQQSTGWSAWVFLWCFLRGQEVLGTWWPSMDQS